MNQRALPIWNSKGQLIGEVSGQIFTKRVRGSKHMLRKPPAWAVDIEGLQKAIRAGARQMRIEDQETRIVYEVALIDFVKRGVRFNRGHNEQMYLLLGEWRQSGGEYEQHSLLP